MLPNNDKLAIQLACCSVTMKVAALALNTARTCNCCNEAIAGDVYPFPNPAAKGPSDTANVARNLKNTLL